MTKQKRRERLEQQQSSAYRTEGTASHLTMVLVQEYLKEGAEPTTKRVKKMA